jgi:hypothetical protein
VLTKRVRVPGEDGSSSVVEAEQAVPTRTSIIQLATVATHLCRVPF